MSLDILSSFAGASSTEDQPRWCRRWYNLAQRAFLDLDHPLWGVTASAWRGLLAEQVVPLRAREPLLWRAHYELLEQKMRLLGLDSYALPKSDDLLNAVYLLCHRNQYPPHSVVHIVAWLRDEGGTDMAIFQRLTPANPLDVNSEPLFLQRAAPSFYMQISSYDSVGSNRFLETISDRQARQDGFDGAVLAGPDGTLRRSTRGNIFLLLPDAVALAVSREAGAALDPLDGPVRKVLEQRNMRLRETPGLTAANVSDAFECFVCSSEVGLRAVMSLGGEKRFLTDSSMRLAADLRSLVEG